MTTVANSVLFIYTGPVICILLARIFRKEPMSVLQWICLVAVIIGTLFGNNIIGFTENGFEVSFSLEMSTPEYPQKGIGDIFGLLSGVFYGSSMFFNGYRKDADTTARGVWNFLAAALAVELGAQRSPDPLQLGRRVLAVHLLRCCRSWHAAGCRPQPAGC